MYLYYNLSKICMNRQAIKRIKTYFYFLELRIKVNCDCFKPINTASTLFVIGLSK